MKAPKRTVAILFTACLLSLPLGAQNVRRVVRILENDPPPEAEPPADEAPEEEQGDEIPLFYLRDRSKVAGNPKIDVLQVTTRYGRLSIPCDQLVRVRFAQRVDPAIKAAVSREIARLGSDDFDEREEAMAAIRRIGAPALPLLRAAVDSPNEEIKNRAGILVDELKDAQEKEASAYADETLPRIEGTDDEIATTRMTIKGRVELEKIVIQSRYGDLVVDVADLESVTFQRAGPSSLKIQIQPKYQPPGNWLDTKLDVEKGQRLSIEATGAINVSNYGVTSGPAGNTQWSGNSFNNLPMLALIGKIGKKGKPFLVGNEYKGKATSGGRLYLSIVPFSYNPTGAAGQYEAKIRLASPN